MVTFGQAIREGKMAVHTDDFRMITGRRPITVRDMFALSIGSVRGAAPPTW